MFFYIYDSFLAEKKYEKQLDKIESRLTDLGIAGKIIRLSILKNIEEIIKDIPEKDSPTIVIVGKDETFYQAGKALVGRRTPLGFIPIKKNSSVAKLLGLPTNEFSCDVLSARLIETIDLGKINNEIFFSFIDLPAQEALLACDHQYLIKTSRLRRARIINLGLLRLSSLAQEATVTKLAANPRDGYLEILIGNPGKKILLFAKKEKLDSLFFAKEITITSKKRNRKFPIIIDGGKTISSPADVGLATKKIRLVVGRNRLI